MIAQTIQYQDNGSIKLLEVAVGDPADGEVQLVGGACGICSWDIATAKLGSRMNPMAPPGHEGIGYVAKVGHKVQGFKEGDRVAGGGFATVRNLPATQVYKIPDSKLPDEHWIVEPISCAVTGLDHCRLRPGDRVAVIGSGFMGMLILQGLLHMPVNQLIAIDVAQSRLDLALQIGVSEVFNAATIGHAGLVEELSDREYDIVVDTTGSQAGLDLATDLVRRGGLINLFGWIKGETAAFDPTKWHGKGITIANSSPSARLRDPFPVAIRMIDQGIFNLKPLVSHVAPLPEYPDLMDDILHNNIGYVKGVITL